VTAPAFGIDTNAWESLTQMATGYGCGATPNFQTLTEVISTNTSGGGLNPLPAGSLTVTWSAYTANVSGFGGYDRSPPNYTFGGNGYNPGNEQVYWGFLRDGVNFGPGSSSGDNDQPGYTIDITGLKSLFTNTPFVVELVASADSMQYLTNAFIIDAVAQTTQSVIYPYTPPVHNSGDTKWVRGIGGGLSTGTTSINTDHLQIIGNRAAHDTVNGTYNFSSTIAGFIVTDKPVISMPPQPVLACPGDTVQLSAYAIGVPPLSYQWRYNGVPIAGATTATNTVAIPSGAAAASRSGNYDLIVANLYGQATSAVAIVTIDSIALSPGTNYVVDSNPKGPEHDGLNFGATWVASSTDSLSKTRTGVMSFDTYQTNQITVPDVTNFDTTTGTIAFWFRSPTYTNVSGNGAVILDRLSSGASPNGLEFTENVFGDVDVKIFDSGNTANELVSTAVLTDTNWHSVVVTYDQSGTGQASLYIDGSFEFSYVNQASWAWPAGQQIEIGASQNSGLDPYSGLLDDVRLYNRILTATEVASIYSSNALVDTDALVLQLNFDAAPGPGVTLSWQCTDGTLQSANSILGPWTDVPTVGSVYSVSTQKGTKFYRYHGHTPVTKISNPYLM